MKKIHILLTAVALIGCLAGCASKEIQQAAETETLCLEGINQQIAMDAAEKVLRNMQFQIEKYDPDASYLRTRPLSGGQFFEVWRSDNASSYQASQANIHSLRRIVEMEFSTLSQSTYIHCVVYVQRLSVPEQPVSGMSDMASLYTSSNRRDQSLAMSEARMEQMEWIELEPDTALQQRILERIENVIKKESTR